MADNVATLPGAIMRLVDARVLAEDQLPAHPPDRLPRRASKPSREKSDTLLNWLRQLRLGAVGKLGCHTPRRQKSGCIRAGGLDEQYLPFMCSSHRVVSGMKASLFFPEVAEG